jgi:GAF domain-containing protein
MPTDRTSPSPDSRGVARQISHILLRDRPMESVLQELTDLARTVLAEDAEASITMVTDGRATTITYTGQLALDCDERQYETGHGPCLHAASTGDMVEISDTQLDPRWTDYACWAAERGALSSLSVPLPVSDRVSGALNVYSRRAEGFDEDSRAAATEFAPFGAVVLDNMSAYQDARVMVDNLQVALESRAVIDQAKGILMERHRLTAEQAFQYLTRASSLTNTKLRLVAEHLVNTGALPETGHRL